jgi:hypothetical protein
MTKTEAERLAAAIHELRPDWPVASLVTYLAGTHAHRAYRDIAVALAYVATDPATRTPKRIEGAGPWWQVAPEPNRTPEPPPIDQLCDHGRDRDLCGCGTRAAAENDWSEISKRGAAAARAHIARAIPHHAEEATA